MKITYLAATVAVLALGATSQAVIIINTPGSTITENFDGLGSSNVTGLFSGTAGVQSAITGSTFDGAKIGGTGTAATNLIASDGSSNTGAIYTLGAVGNSERALGAVASGTNIFGFGVQITNNTGAALNSLNISFTQENWRSSTSVQNVFTFGYAVGGSASSYLTDTGFATNSALDLVGPDFVASNGALNGNDPVNQVLRSATLTFAAPLANGQSVFLRWSDVNDGGNDAALAIDNFSVSTDAVPEPATMAILGFGIAALARRKRK